MDIKTFRAKTMREALALVRRELGPEAAVLHTRELNARPAAAACSSAGKYEVAASAERECAEPAAGTLAGSGLERRRRPSTSPYSASRLDSDAAAARSTADYRRRHRDDSAAQVAGAARRVAGDGREALPARAHRRTRTTCREALFDVFTDLIEADVDEDDRPRAGRPAPQRAARSTLADPLLVKARLAATARRRDPRHRPDPADAGAGRVVALVGPTGVGKTTTIAKLAANFRLREKRRVGLITVDTYRIAAVEQLRTYADIIDLPMEVVSTPREMREAVARMSDLDLVLMDTAGRSPRDEVQDSESCKSMLAEAEPDEVHLVLSAAGGARSLAATAEKFADVGTTALLLTKLDEATGLGNLLSLARTCGLPFSYLTDGQNVPDDISGRRAASGWRN